MDNAIIIGAGTYGQVYAEYISDSKLYNIVAFLDDDVSLHGKEFCGIKVLGAITMLDQMESRKNTSVFVPLGDNINRVKFIEYAKVLGYQTPCFIHPSVELHQTVIVGASVYILPRSQIMPYTIIADYVMISMGVNIAHHTTINQGCFISLGVNIGANINIEENSFLGIASTIMTGVKNIGNSALIGAGSVIIKDVPDFATVVGNPGRVV